MSVISGSGTTAILVLLRLVVVEPPIAIGADIWRVCRHALVTLELAPRVCSRVSALRLRFAIRGDADIYRCSRRLVIHRVRITRCPECIRILYPRVQCLSVCARSARRAISPRSLYRQAPRPGFSARHHRTRHPECLSTEELDNHVVLVRRAGGIFHITDISIMRPRSSHRDFHNLGFNSGHHRKIR